MGKIVVAIQTTKCCSQVAGSPAPSLYTGALRFSVSLETGYPDLRFY